MPGLFPGPGRTPSATHRHALAMNSGGTVEEGRSKAGVARGLPLVTLPLGT